MKVEKVIVRTIKRSKKRQAAVKACLIDSGIPEHLIEIYMGVDAQGQSEEDVEAILEQNGLYFHQQDPTLKFSYVCSSLSFYKALKEIRWSNKTTMLMNDDKRLKIPFCEFQELLSELPYDAKVFQPQWYLHPEDEKDFPHFCVEKVCFLKAYSPFIKGLLPSDDVLVFTPEGADWALDQIRNNSRKHRAGHAITISKSKGLYTSKNDLTAEIGGQGYWKSAHGGH